MALTYFDRDEAITTINQWIIDGSHVESFGSSHDCEWINLRGKDGVLEEFIIYYDEETLRAFERDGYKW